MKITASQLRKIIKEETAKVIKENSLMAAGPGSAAFAQGIDEAAAEWEGRYSEDDPVIGEYGEDAWYEQVMAAKEDLENKILAAYNEVDDKLSKGEYYRSY